MTRDEAIQEACSIVALAYRGVGDYSRASDWFCARCNHDQNPDNAFGLSWSYQNQGQALAFVRAAVVEKLTREGYSIPEGFGPDGREVNP